MDNRRCVVPGCSTRSGDGIALHSFPKLLTDSARRAQWLEIVGIAESKLTSTSYVCTKHFDLKYIIPMSRGSCRLMGKAVPTINVTLNSEVGYGLYFHQFSAACLKTFSYDACCQILDTTKCVVSVCLSLFSREK
jgi:hypothetical protein